MTEIRVQVPTLHAGQRQAVSRARRFNVLRCGRRWGKTKFGVHRLLTGPNSLLDGYPAGWFAPSGKYVDEVWDEIIERTRGLIAHKDKQKGRIKFITGGSIDFWAMGENKDVGRGRRYSRVIVDEAAHIRYLEDAWDRAVAPTLTDFRGEAWFISTPNGMNFFSDLDARGRADQDPDWMALQMPTSSNPHIHPDEIERQRRNLPALVFAQEYLAEFITFGAGLVKPEMLIDAPCPLGLPIVLGVDLAISEKQEADWTAIVAMARDPSSGIVYIREAERHRCGFNEVLGRIKAASARHNPVIIHIEQTQYQAAVVQELARTTTLPVRGVRPDKDKVTRFSPLLTRFEQHLVRLDPSGVPAWFRDELTAFPSGQHDDGCFVAGTMVLTARGAVAIEDVAKGDYVLTRQGWRSVLESGVTNLAASIYRLEAENETILEGTKNHPIMTQDGWKSLGDLLDCDGIIVCKGIKPTNFAEHHSWVPRKAVTARARVQRVIALQQKRPVYNLVVDEDHEYFANGVLVHNCDAAAYAYAALDQTGAGRYAGHVARTLK